MSGVVAWRAGHVVWDVRTFIGFLTMGVNTMMSNGSKEKFESVIFSQGVDFLFYQG